MRDFKKLLIGQGKDLFHKNMRKFGATVLESHQAFKDIKEGNIEGGGGSASGESDITYLKAASGSQDEFFMAVEFADIFHLNGEVLPIVVASQQEPTIFKGCASIKGITALGMNRDETIADIVSQGHFTEITKEEFYTL